VVRYARDVGPGDAGVRITLRRTLPGGGLGDVLGDLLSWDTVVRVRRRDGSVVEVPAETVVAAKKIPPPPVRRG
jgi:hypothetical protein